MSITTTSLPVTRITYKQASEQLGISVEVLKQAIGRGMLTPLPRQGRERHLIAEQVSLFQGKKLSLASLNKEQAETWKQYRQIATGTTSTHIDPRGIAYSPDFARQLADEAARLLREGKVPEGTPFNDIFSTISQVLRIWVLHAMYLNGNMSEDDIRNAIYSMPAKEQEQAIDTINHTDELKPLRDLIATQ